MASDNRWRNLMAKVNQRAKIRARLGAGEEEIEDIIRPKGMERRVFRKMKSRLVKAEAAIEGFNFRRI